MTDTERSAIVMRAFADEMQTHLARAMDPSRSVGIDIPAPVVNVDTTAPVINVIVDMTPVVNAYERLADEVKGQNDLLSQLIIGLTEANSRPIMVHNLFNPEFKPSFNPKVNVETPRADVHVSLPAPLPVQNKKKQLTITHSDGTQSTVEES